MERLQSRHLTYLVRSYVPLKANSDFMEHGIVNINKKKILAIFAFEMILFLVDLFFPLFNARYPC